MIEGYKTSDHQLELDASTVVLPSSTDLFYFYRETLVQSAKLSTGKAFFDLCNLFGKHLDNYCANVLLGNLPRYCHSTIITLLHRRICLTILNICGA